MKNKILKRIVNILLMTSLTFFVSESLSQCDVVIVNGTQSYNDYDPGVSFTFDIINNSNAPYTNGDFHLGFGFVGGANAPVWSFDLNPAILPGETITITTPVFDIPLYDNPAAWPFWGTTVPNSWPSGEYDFNLFLDGCVFNQVIINNVIITDDTCINPDGDQFCATCDLEVLDFTWPNLTVEALDATGCYNPNGPNPSFLPIPTDTIFLFQIYFLPEPGQVANISNADIPNIGTGDIITVNLLDIIENDVYLNELLWYLDNGCQLLIDIRSPNNIPFIDINETNNIVNIGGNEICEYILGCTDPNATNYDPESTEDDGSCLYNEINIGLSNELIWSTGGSCSDPYYNQSFVIENLGDGSIENFNVTVVVETWDGEMVFIDSQDYDVTINSGDSYTVDNFPNIYTGDLNHVTTTLTWINEFGEVEQDIETFNIILYCWGCTDPNANNFIEGDYVFNEIQNYWLTDFPNINPPTPEQIECTYDVFGCTDPTANNYNPNANIDDGGCIYDIFGCTDPTANNYNPNANIDDGSCTYYVLGCTDMEALNYNPNANTDDGTCIYTSYDSCDEFDGNAFAPNAFTPNNDGLNDVWRVITEVDCWNKWELIIYNRWGQVVYEMNDPSQVWDGSFRGSDYYASDGVYAFTLRGVAWNLSSVETTGFITILR